MSMADVQRKTYEFDAEDVEYLRHDGKPLLARVYKPRGAGPFPALVEAHGGAWVLSDRFTEKVRHEFMASRGIVAVSLDFRPGNEAPYPASVADVNYGVRWVKHNAAALKTKPDLVGISGQSSGGHLAMLVAMKPHDKRYAAIPLPGSSHDASVRCVSLSWPVINPPGRYRFAASELQKANPPEWPKTIMPRQMSYWQSEANMEEGSPMLILERGEKVETPPVIWIQGRGDALHDYKDPDGTFDGTEPPRFVANYRKAGGEIVLEYFEMESAHTGHAPELSERGPQYEKVVAFVKDKLKARA